MSGKDESVFSKEALMGTQAGKDIMKQGLLRSKGYKVAAPGASKHQRLFA